ncbi:hypothetical protein [Cupriavidus agavae]|uniref:DUF4148 domain-containing protein n=1 Tax=Cupriavidus agavae TaxID=1001822 RepID=A0A4Q7RC81_9BURK|nr:hypothetical protein [Cupriavidus agavae]RZT30776.1 hypothetical protein EV147_4624 [Cupriavidus agavae]
MVTPRRLLPLAALLVLIPGSSVWAQAQGTSGAAAAISDAVQEGSNPYRPPSAPNPNDKTNASYEDQRRARCDQLLRDINETSNQRSYKSPGTATTNAQGGAVPKLERDKTLKRLQQSYRDNCS